MKYLVVKGGILGFGDRLESLKMAVNYAIHNNLQIYVDWRDPVWSHGSEDFYTYFKLVNMPVLNSLSDIPEDATYFPPHWKGRLNDQLTLEYTTEHKDANLNIGFLNRPFDGDVIVYSCIGNRLLFTDSTFFGNVFRVVDNRILEKVRYHASRKPLAQSWGVHIRGTDRTKTVNRRMMSIQSIVTNFTMMGGMNMKNMVVVSDDREQTQIWKNYYPDSYVVSEASLKNSNLVGNHLQGCSSLNVSKDDLNVDLLVDFFVLTSCERVFTTIKDSRFAQEARRLHPHVRSILSGV
jgi:hypothetical protein